MKVDYLIHETVYQSRRAQGAPGWMSADQVEWYLARLGEWVEGLWSRPVRVLELWCGAGDQALWLAQQGHDAVGIDICPTAVEWAREKARERGSAAEFVQGSVLALPFPDGSFDWVLDGSCWHCIIGDDRLRFLEEAARVLRPGGVFTGAPMVNGSRYPGLEGYDPGARLHVIDGVTVRYWGLVPELLQDLQDAGLSVVRQRLLPGEEHGGEDALFVDASKRS